MELKDKLSLEDAFEKKLENQAVKNAAPSGNQQNIHEAVEALAALGYSSTEALRAVKKVEHVDTMSVEELLKAALKHMF